jgi:serine/threonine protein phosphatase PrpC
MGMIHYQVFAKTDIGRKRSQNEDSFLVDQDLNLFIVADGMGGHAAGEIASNIAAKEVKKIFQDNQALLTKFKEDPIKSNRWAVKELMDKAIQAANERVYQLSRLDPQRKKMGTTLTCFLLLENHGLIGHVGDSSIHLIRNKNIHQLTDDHTLAHLYISQGRLTKKEAEKSPYQNVLTRAVGVQEWIQADLIDFELEPDDQFIMASDGLTGYLSPLEIQEYVRTVEIDQVPPSMILAANEKGGRDNITVVAIQIEKIIPEETLLASATRKIESLKKIPLFKKLTYQQLTQMANILVEEHYREDEKIITEGEIGDKFFICLEGVVRVQKSGSILSELKAGDYFGEMALVDNMPRSADVIVSKDCHILSMTRSDLFHLIKENPSIAVKFLWSFTQVLTSRLRRTTEDYSIACGEPMELTDLFEQLGTVED